VPNRAHKKKDPDQQTGSLEIFHRSILAEDPRIVSIQPKPKRTGDRDERQKPQGRAQAVAALKA